MKTNNKSVIVGWLVCSIGALFYAYEYFLRIQPSVMVHPLMHQFHLTAASFGFLVGLYYFAYTPTQLIVGVAVDRYGSRKVLTGALIICIIGLTLFTYSSHVVLACIGRSLIGFGSAFAFVAILKLAVVWLPPRHFAMFAGVATSLAMISGMIGDVGMTHLLTLVGWRDVLEIGIVIGVILVPLIWFGTRGKKSATGKSKTIDKHISTKEIFRDSLKIIINPQMWLAGLIGCMLYLSLSVFAELWGISFLRVVHHLTPKLAADCNAFVFLGWLIGSPISGWLTDHLKSRRMPLLVAGLASAGAIIVVIYVTNLSVWELKLLLFLFGAFCSAEIIVFAVGKENYALNVSGTALAVINMIVMLGGFVFQPLVGMLLDWRWSGAMQGHVPIYAVSDYQHALILLPMGMIVAAVLSLILKETHGNVVT